MNLRQFKQNVGTHVQLVPFACRLDEFGRELLGIDDDWFIQEINDEHIRISNPRTGHFVISGKDHIHHYPGNPQRSQNGAKFGFLTLCVQIFIRRNDVLIRPTLRPGGRIDPPSVNLTDKFVDIENPANCGLKQKLDTEDYKLYWCAEANLSRRIDLEEWEIVIEPDRRGALFSFRVKDRIDDLILIKQTTC